MSIIDGREISLYGIVIFCLLFFWNNIILYNLFAFVFFSAAAASRDVTLFKAHDILHEFEYDLTAALKSLVPSNGPMLCRDEMEDWSASEANLFEEALEKYGKDFNDIRKDYLPWKTMKNIIEYFFMWKTTDRYFSPEQVK